MKERFEGLPGWVDQRMLERLFDPNPADESSGGVGIAAGKLLLAQGDIPAHLAKMVREGLEPYFARAGLTDAELTFSLAADAAWELWEGSSGGEEEPGQGGEARPGLLSLLLAGEVDSESLRRLAHVRHDLEALYLAMARASLHGGLPQPERLDLLLAEMRSTLQELDERVEPHAESLRRRVDPDRVDPALLAAVARGENPWWLDIVDPFWQLLKGRMGQPAPAGDIPKRLVAATSPPGEVIAIREVPGLGRLEFYRNDRGLLLSALRLEGVTGESLQPLDPLALCWPGDSGEQTALFKRMGEGSNAFYDLAEPLPESVLEADPLAVTGQGASLWVAGPCREPS